LISRERKNNAAARTQIESHSLTNQTGSLAAPEKAFSNKKTSTAAQAARFLKLAKFVNLKK